MNITLRQAQAATEAAHQKAFDMGLKMNIAVVDAGANLVTFARMEGAWLGSINIAIKKAKTARYFDMPTGDLGQPGGPAARSTTLRSRTVGSSPFLAAS